MARYFDTAADARVLAHCHWHPEPRSHPTIVLLHGLEGSSTVHYMRGMADKAWAAGWNVVRLNQRNCGGTEALSRGLYHSGLTHDPLFVMRELIDADGLPAIALAGYSLGGNVALKLAGDLGDEAPPQLVAVCAVSPTMDLAVCVDALERRANYPYQWNFVRNLKARMRRKAALFPDDFSVAPLGRIWASGCVRLENTATPSPRRSGVRRDRETSGQTTQHRERTCLMGSSSKRQTTMAKMKREQMVKARRAAKIEEKQAAAAAKRAGVDPTLPDPDPVSEDQPAASDRT